MLRILELLRIWQGIRYVKAYPCARRQPKETQTTSYVVYRLQRALGRATAIVNTYPLSPFSHTARYAVTLGPVRTVWASHNRVCSAVSRVPLKFVRFESRWPDPRSWFSDLLSKIAFLRLVSSTP